MLKKSYFLAGLLQWVVISYYLLGGMGWSPPALQPAPDMIQLWDNTAWDSHYNGEGGGDNPFLGETIYAQWPSDAAFISSEPHLQIPADDFIIPANVSWKIYEISVLGFYGINTTDSNFVVPGLQVRIYLDDNGMPQQNPWMEVDNVQCYYPTTLLYPAYDLVFNPPLIINGTGETLWLSVTPEIINAWNGSKSTFPQIGFWFFQIHNRPIGYQGYVRDFNATFGPNSNWTLIGSHFNPLELLGNHTDWYWSMYGESVLTADLNLVIPFTTTTGSGSSTVTSDTSSLWNWNKKFKSLLYIMSSFIWNDQQF